MSELDLDEWERTAAKAVEWGIVHDKPARIVALIAEVRRLRAEVQRLEAWWHLGET